MVGSNEAEFLVTVMFIYGSMDSFQQKVMLFLKKQEQIYFTKSQNYRRLSGEFSNIYKWQIEKKQRTHLSMQEFFVILL